MATPNAAGSSRQPHVPTEIEGESPSGTSNSVGSDYDSNRRLLQTCRWRTARYCDQECARYFDCPSHVVERALSDTEQRPAVAEEEHQEQENAEDEEDTQGAVSPLSEDDEEEDGARSARSPSPELQVPATEVTNAAAVGTSGTPEALGTQHDDAAVGSSSDLAPADSLHSPGPLAGRRGSGEEQNEPPVSPVPRPVPRNDGAVSGPQATNTSASSLASVTSPVPTSPPILSSPAERVHSGAVLPRWQPDSEQTYCPICGTQFSIFVRKHHCR